MIPTFEGIVAVCTRGAILTEVLDGIIDNIIPKTLNGRFWTIKTTKNKKIPDAQNSITEEILKLGPRFIWYVEEDTAPPHGILTQMINCRESVVVADYPIEGGQRAIHFHGDRVAYSGMGCMLVNTAVFYTISAPWFETGAWSLEKDGTFSKKGHSLPGRQDVGFFVKLKEHNIQAYAVKYGPCKHLRVKWGDQGFLHEIREL